MSDANAFDFGKFIPGFDFLQKLSASAPGAGGAAPGLHSWVAPTVSVDELDKRIKELKAVLFWLEQNGTALKATIQALEVQKMTLAALAGMNLNMAEVAKAFTVPTGGAGTTAAPPAEPPRPEGWPYATAPMPASAAKPVEDEPAASPAEPPVEAAPAPAPPPAAPARKRSKTAAASPAPTAAAGLADPMQWWGALTQQFQHIAANAMRDAARAAATTAADAAANTPDSIAAGAGQTGAKASKRPAKKTTAKRPAKKAAAKKRAAPAAKKAAKQTAKKAPASKAAAPKDSAPKSALGWPLPPPFKLGR